MSRRLVQTCCAFLTSFAFALSAVAGSNPKNNSGNASGPAYEAPQPERETLDLNMYQLIRNEGIGHSHVMEYASALDDGIGPRLTGSPNLKRANEWTRDQFTAMGCSNAHLEDWGEFGMGWQQLNTWVRMTSPDTAVMIAQAAPWSPATQGAISAPAIWIEVKEEKDLDKYKGKLAGHIVLYGDMREVKPVEKPLWTRLDDAELKDLAEYPTKPRNEDFLQQFMKRLELRQKVGQFLAAEHALAAITPSRDGRNGGGSGGTIFDDSGAGFGWSVYKRENTDPLPVVVMAIEKLRANLSPAESARARQH